VVSPQCPEHSFWPIEADAIMALLDELIATYEVDASRIYLTGLSMGGWGTWNLAITNPSRFAAIVPICGGEKPAKASALKDVPIWAFHGAKDEVVPVSESEAMVNAINEIGGNAKLT